MKNKSVFLFISVLLLMFGFISCSQNQTESNISITIPAEVCNKIFTAASRNSEETVEPATDQTTPADETATDETATDQPAATDETATTNDTATTDETSEKDETPAEPRRYYVIIRLYVNSSYHSQVSKSWTSGALSASFSKIKIGSQVYAEVEFREVNSKGKMRLMAKGKCDPMVVAEDSNVLEVEVTLDENNPLEDFPADDPEPKPVDPTDPDNPDNPDNPEDPDNPDNLENPEDPEEPDNPENKIGEIQITITIQEPQTNSNSDGQVEVLVDGTAVTKSGAISVVASNASVSFKAPTTYSSYKWKVDGTVQNQTGDIFTLSLLNLSSGVHDITLLAERTDDAGQKIYYSYSAQVKKD